MAFKKGQSGNPAGKPPGTLAKKTVEQISRARKLIEAIENHPKWATILDDLSAKELKEWHKDLLEYVEPKLTRTEHTDGEGGPLVITVRHSIKPPQLPTNDPEIIEDAPFEIITPATTGPVKHKRPF